MATSPPESAIRKLRRTMLDAQRGLVPSAMLDCGAHMLVYLDDPQTMLQIGLTHLLDHFAATRADVGFGSPFDPKYRASASQSRKDCDVPDMIGFAWPNQHRMIQGVWRSPGALYCDAQHDPIVGSLLPTLQALRVRSKLARRLEYGNNLFGIICIDQTEECRRWKNADQIYLDQFVLCFLSPLMAERRAARNGMANDLTLAEQAVVRLAIQGLSYKEIAARLNKSPNTVDNQLSQIRRKLGVRNQVELVRACTHESDT